jgi:plasmid stabilization system protein ParE
LSGRKKSARKVRLKLAHRAVNDLRAIERYSFEKWGRRTADRYLDDIAAALDRIQQQPDILRLEPQFAADLFFYRVHNHFLVCDYQADCVIVLTVIHTSMDIPRRLQELEPRLVAEAELMRNRLRGRAN